MKKLNLPRLSNDELVERFSAAAKRRGAAVLDLNSRRANALFGQMKAIDDELRARGRNVRLVLAPLLKDSDRVVRFYAAEALLGIVPEASREIMEWDARYEVDSISADARGFLWALDAGTYKPD
jgi:hypothetical protein